MNKESGLLKTFVWLTFRSAVCIGLVLLVLVMLFSGYLEGRSNADIAANTMSTLKQQCISFNRLTAADRTKSLFRLSDLMQTLSAQLERQPELATDEYLEHFVDSLRLSGVALLDDTLTLEASGYTRRYRHSAWPGSDNQESFADILEHPAKIYVERIELVGEYYDVCAVSRRDAPGVIIGFYRQPSGLITSMETDLESLLNGLHLEQGGQYIVAENGAVRVTSDETMLGTAVVDNALLQKLSGLPKDDRLHPFFVGTKAYLGCRSGCENYSLFIYYPAAEAFSVSLMTAVAFAAAYSILCLFVFAARNRALHENQAALRQSNRDLRRTINMLQSLETIYFSLFYVDLRADWYDSIYVAPWLQSAVPQKGVYTELKQMFLDTMMVPEYQKDVDERMSPAFIRQTLCKENITEVRRSFYTDYQAIRGDRNPWCRVTVTVVDYDDEGKPFHVLALIQDIDEEKAREAAYQARILKEAHDAKVANNAKTSFLRRISHDIRTPINGIQGYIDMAGSHPDDAALQEHCREKASVALHTLLELVNGVLEMSKLESSEVVLEEKPFDLRVLLDDVDTVLAPQAAAKNVRFEEAHGEAAAFPHLIGSPQHLNQILLNIATNGVKYTRSGGCIRLNTRLLSHTGDMVMYEFVCEDTGIGMSQEFQQHMFEPFVQESNSARSTYEGVGLGLSIVKKLVDAMGGTIACQSEKDVGTTFRIRLSFRIDPQPEPDEQVPVMDNTVLRGKHILLVEDNELNMEIAALFLTEHGASVTKAWNGREAVERFAASAPGQFDLILMDIMMPEMNGLEATRAIRALTRPDAKTIPILAMSANSFQDDVQRSLEAGMNGHVSKPIDSTRLCAVLSGYIHS